MTLASALKATNRSDKREWEDAPTPTGMPQAGSISIPTKLLATGVACAVAVVVCSTAATVVVASDVTNKMNRGGRAQGLTAGDAAGGRAPFRDTGATAQAIDSLLAPLGAPQSIDLSTVAKLNAFNSAQAPNPIWTAVPADLPAPVPVTKYRRTPADAGGMTFEELEVAATATTDPWLPLFRAWARGPRQPALFGYRVGLPGPPDDRALPIRSYGPWRALFAENEYALRSALEAGRHTEAMQHALENVAAARQFIEQPVLIDAMVGRTYLMRSLKLVAVVANRSGDTATANRALRLDVAARSMLNTSGLRALAQESGNPESTAALEFIGNRQHHPALRVDAMRTITMGGCRRLPELVFGFSSARRGALQVAAAGLSDIQRGDELAAREQRVFDYVSSVNSAPDVLPKNSVLEKNVLLNTFAWIVPPGVRGRVALCLGENIRAETAPIRENSVVGVH